MLPEKGQLPRNIPANPNQTYKNQGWVSWGNWLGTGTVGPGLRQYCSFKQAQAFVHRLKLKSNGEWRKYCKGKLHGKGQLGKGIPTNPNRIYKDKGWINWGDWLGTGTVATRKRKYLPFKQARAFVHRLKLKNSEEWKKLSTGQLLQKRQLPSNIPGNPRGVYKGKGWKSMGDWLGKTKK